MKSIAELPELRALDGPDQLIRLPDQLDVPVTQRVLRLIDSQPFRRLAEIRQLGLVALVYPGATHSRFEHSLGVYRNAVLVLKRLKSDSRFEQVMSLKSAEAFIVAALLHDIGHWPYCHPIEDLALPQVPSHETLAAAAMQTGELAECLANDWHVGPDDVAAVISGRCDDRGFQLASSLLSGPLDIDKIDYLYRDSLHAGVPYGRHFDVNRLISSLCLNGAGDRVAITSKGRTAAELLVFARYVMFNEVYWHHTVRAATAMLQRAFYALFSETPPTRLWSLVDREWEQALRAAAEHSECQPLVEGLFGPRRRLYKRWIQLSSFDNPQLYARLARRPYAWAVELSKRLTARLRAIVGNTFGAFDLLVDSPPVGLEVQFAVDVWDSRRGQYHSLRDVSPVVAALAQRQFDEFVKQFRLFVAPNWIDRVQQVSPIAILEATLAEMPESV